MGVRGEIVESTRCRRRPSGGVAGGERSSRIEMDACTKTRKTSSCRVITTGILLELFKALLHLHLFLFPRLSQHVYTRNQCTEEAQNWWKDNMDRKALVLANAWCLLVVSVAAPVPLLGPIPRFLLLLYHSPFRMHAVPIMIW